MHHLFYMLNRDWLLVKARIQFLLLSDLQVIKFYKPTPFISGLNMVMLCSGDPCFLIERKIYVQMFFCCSHFLLQFATIIQLVAHHSETARFDGDSKTI